MSAQQLCSVLLRQPRFPRTRLLKIGQILDERRPVLALGCEHGLRRGGRGLGSGEPGLQLQDNPLLSCTIGLSIRQLFLKYRPALGRSVERGPRLGRQCALTGNLGLERREPLFKPLFFNQGPLHFGAQRRVFPVSLSERSRNS